MYLFTRHTPWSAPASAESLEHSAPVEFDGSSNHPISCLSIASNVIFLILWVRCSPAVAYIVIYRKNKISNLWLTIYIVILSYCNLSMFIIIPGRRTRLQPRHQEEGTLVNRNKRRFLLFQLILITILKPVSKQHKFLLWFSTVLKQWFIDLFILYGNKVIPLQTEMRTRAWMHPSLLTPKSPLEYNAIPLNLCWRFWRCWSLVNPPL